MVRKYHACRSGVCQFHPKNWEIHWKSQLLQIFKTKWFSQKNDILKEENLYHYQGLIRYFSVFCVKLTYPWTTCMIFSDHRNVVNEQFTICRWFLHIQLAFLDINWFMWQNLKFSKNRDFYVIFEIWPQLCRIFYEPRRNFWPPRCQKWKCFAM